MKFGGQQGATTTALHTKCGGSSTFQSEATGV